MVYIFERVDENGSRHRTIYERFAPAMKHLIRFREVPKVRKTGNKIW